MVDNHGEELGVAELPAETEREHDALSEAEYLADLQEVDAANEAIQAEAFATDIVSDQPSEGIEPIDDSSFNLTDTAENITEMNNPSESLDL